MTPLPRRPDRVARAFKSYPKTQKERTRLWRVIARAATALSSDQPYPGWDGLLPVAGAMLIVHESGRRTLARRLLSLRPLVFVGRISYSLYLLNWPLIVFWRLYTNGVKLTSTASAGLTAASLVLGEHLSPFAIAGLTVASLATVVFALPEKNFGGSRKVRNSALLWAMATGACVAIYNVIDAQGVRAGPSQWSFIVWLFVLDWIGINTIAFFTPGTKSLCRLRACGAMAWHRGRRVLADFILDGAVRLFDSAGRLHLRDARDGRCVRCGHGLVVSARRLRSAAYPGRGHSGRRTGAPAVWLKLLLRDNSLGKRFVNRVVIYWFKVWTGH